MLKSNNDESLFQFVTLLYRDMKNISFLRGFLICHENENIS